MGTPKSPWSEAPDGGASQTGEGRRLSLLLSEKTPKGSSALVHVQPLVRGSGEPRPTDGVESPTAPPVSVVGVMVAGPVRPADNGASLHPGLADRLSHLGFSHSTRLGGSAGAHRVRSWQNWVVISIRNLDTGGLNFARMVQTNRRRTGRRGRAGGPGRPAGDEIARRQGRRQRVRTKQTWPRP